MLGRNGQRKPGTTRGSPRRSRTAKALRISCDAVKSRCARGWGGWGRLSDDGSRQHNSSQSEDPWGGGLPILHGGARSSARPDTARDHRCTTTCAKGGCKPNLNKWMSGAGLSLLMCGKVPPYMPAFQPYRGKPAVRNDREGRGNDGIIRSPGRASTLPDCGGRAVKRASLPLHHCDPCNCLLRCMSPQLAHTPRRRAEPKWVRFRSIAVAAR
jgi:hypothetical protein